MRRTQCDASPAGSLDATNHLASWSAIGLESPRVQLGTTANKLGSSVGRCCCPNMTLRMPLCVHVRFRHGDAQRSAFVRWPFFGFAYVQHLSPHSHCTSVYRNAENGHVANVHRFQPNVSRRCHGQECAPPSHPRSEYPYWLVKTTVVSMNNAPFGQNGLDNEGR